MYILGINLSHHASVCLLHDGEVIFYLEDDRLSKLKEGEWELDDPCRALEKIPHFTSHVHHIIFASFGKGKDFESSDQKMIEYILGKIKFTYDYIHNNWEHHLYHAYNAFYSTNFERAGAVVMDAGGVSLMEDCQGMGAWREVESLYDCSQGDIKPIFRHYSLPSVTSQNDPVVTGNLVVSSSLSCGTLFNDITDSLGLSKKHIQEGGIRAKPVGKVMGLSSYGKWDWNMDPWFREVDGVWVTSNKVIYDEVIRTGVSDMEISDPNIFFAGARLAKKLQEETKFHTIRLIERLLDNVDTNNVVLSGGYFLNCVNNYAYVKKFPEINFYVDPIAHDGGTAMGAARYIWHHFLEKEERHPLKTLFLGGS